MLHRFLPILFLAALVTAPLPAQDVAYEKYTLQNGMTVILHVDHSLPSVTVNTWFHVGARNEPPGRSGFAHLFEHLMFMGTERVPGNDFDVLMETGGGANNASTTLDRTNYFSDGPASLLPTLLWLDADRLEDLGRAMDVAKLDKQRDVVRNEIRQNVENRPYGRADEAVFGLMFPPGHPYHNAVYGTHRDLEAATVFDVKDFFATFYVPNNASLVIAGDFDPERIKPLVAQLFGTLPRGGDVAPVAAAPATLDHVARMTMLDKAQQALVKMVWHSPGSFAAGDAELKLLGAILAQGKDSRLYKRMVMDEQIATDVSAYQDGAALGSLFQIDVTVAPGVDLDRIERTVREELARLQRDGVTAEELEQRRAGYELRTLMMLQSNSRIADMLNQYESVWGEPNSFKRDLDRFRSATTAGLQDWAKQVFDPQRCGIIRVLPEDGERAASARDQRPPDAPMAAFAPQQPQSFTLPNGMQGLLWHKPELPLVSLMVQFQPGHVLTDPAHAGLAALTASMLDEGAGDLDALQFTAAVQKLGAWFSTGADHETATASLTVLKRNLDAGTALLASALRQPRLAAADWERIVRLHLDGLRQSDDRPGAVASRIAMRTLFGAANPYGWPVGGTVDSVSKLTLDDVRQEYRRLFDPATAVILVAGDLTVEEARATFGKALGDWRGGVVAATPPTDLAAAPGKQLRVVLVDRPDAVQTVIQFVAPGSRYSDPQRMQYQLLNTLLGGGFTSRLNQNLRERHGFTYGAGSGYSMSPFAGWFTASASVQTQVTGAAVKEFLAEFGRLRGEGGGDVTEEEAQKARETLRTAVVDSFAGLGGILSTASDLVLNNLPFDRVAKDLASIGAVDAKTLNAMCRAALPIDQGVMVLVGDKRAILEQLQGLGLPAIEELDVRGEPVGR